MCMLKRVLCKASRSMNLSNISQPYQLSLEHHSLFYVMDIAKKLENYGSFMKFYEKEEFSKMDIIDKVSCNTYKIRPLKA